MLALHPITSPVEPPEGAELACLRAVFLAMIPALERLASSRAVVIAAAQAAIDYERSVDGWVEAMNAEAKRGE